MDPFLVLLLCAVVVVVVVVGASILVRSRRDRYVVEMPTMICVFCSRPIADTDHVAAMKKEAVRELLGMVPTAFPPTTDPLGNPRWFGHADCASRAGADLRAAGKLTGGPPPSPDVGPGERVCPACGHHFRPPAIVISTEDFVRRYGRSAEQCPRCDHIWDPGGPPREIIRG